MKLPRKLYLFIFIIVVLFLGYLFLTSNNKSQQVSTQNNTVALWNNKLADTFDDEPKIETIELNNLKISSSSSWTVPADPHVIATDPILKFPVDRLFADENALTIGDWNKYPYSKESLDKQNLDKKYYDHFFKNGLVPVSSLAMDVDVNGDGTDDKLFQSYGLGCASCHVNYIDIFIGDKRYEARTNEGGIYPRSDHKGFYITNAFTGKDYATCCPDNFVISKYEWNGDGFTEIARKNIKLRSNQITNDKAIEIVKNLPEVKDFLQGMKKINTKTLVEVDKRETDQIVIHVTEINDHGLTATFNWYTLDNNTGTIKCSFAIYSGDKYIRNNDNYPCD